MNCGIDLARQRATPDPHHHLPLVICPRCGWACARRVQQIKYHRRARRQACKAITLLVLQGLILFFVTLVNITLVVTLAETRLLLDDATWLDPWLLIPIPLIIVPFVTGPWLKTGLTHWPTWIVFTAWGIWIMAWSAAFWFDAHQQIPIGRDLITACVLVLATAAVGVPLGRVLTRALHAHAAWRIARLRRRLRRRRVVA